MVDYTATENAAEKNPNLDDMIVMAGGRERHLRSEFGLWLKTGSPDFGEKEVESKLEYAPGYDFVWNFTQAVDGQVHYKQRVIKAELACLRPQSQWEGIRSRLETLMQGHWLEFWFKKHPEIKYQGLFEVELTPGQRRADVTISATCDPD